MKLCESIRKKRELLGMSQDQFAAEVGVSGGTISNFENGAEVSEHVFKSIKYAMTAIENRLSPEELDKYRIMYAAWCVCNERDVQRTIESAGYLNTNLGRFLTRLVKANRDY